MFQAYKNFMTSIFIQTMTENLIEILFVGNYSIIHKSLKKYLLIHLHVHL